MNNFDTSTSGENIELFCHYDVDLASIYYRDFERENTRIDFGRDSVMFLIGDADGLYYSELDLKAKSKQALFDLCLDYELLDYSVALNDYKKSEYIADLMRVTHRQHYKYLTANHTWHDLRDKIQHCSYISRGYSQGDAVYIVSLDEPITNDKREYINRILWDCPVSMRVTVNDTEYFEDSFLNDMYEWDADAVKSKVYALPLSDYAKAWIVDALPDYPQYL